LTDALPFLAPSGVGAGNGAASARINDHPLASSEPQIGLFMPRKKKTARSSKTSSSRSSKPPSPRAPTQPLPNGPAETYSHSQLAKQRPDVGVQGKRPAPTALTPGISGCELGFRLELSRNIPRQQLFDAIDRMFSDPLEHVAQISLRI
jgi:hypothetical protein